MRSFIPVLAVALSLPYTALTQTTAATAAAVPPSVIVPFPTLPSCAAQCGPLQDAQGACSPPVQAVNKQCFCSYATLQPFYQSTLNVCNNACPNDSSGLLKIQQWFSTFCGSTTTTTTGAGAATGTATGTATTGGTATGTSAGGAATSGSSSSTTNNGTW